MSHFLVQAAYTMEAWQNLVSHPQNRMEIVRASIERLGGKMIGGWAAFGDYDVVIIAEAPSAVDAAALSIAAAAGGSLRTIKTTPLLTAEEAAEALKKASASGYRPVSGAQAAAG